MNAVSTMEVVTRSVLTLQAHLHALATEATDWPVMEGPVRTLMNALLTLTTASSAASILLGDSGVNATLDSDLTLINGHVLVSSFIGLSEPTNLKAYLTDEHSSTNHLFSTLALHQYIAVHVKNDNKSLFEIQIHVTDV